MASFIPMFKNEKIRKKGLVITVSGVAGVGKTTLGRYIARELGLKFASAGEIIRQTARKEKKDLIKFLESEGPAVHHRIEKMMLAKIKEGECVLDGRLAGWTAGDYADLKILLKANIRERAKRIARREGVPVRKALSQTRKRDEEDRQLYRKLYGIDLNDESIYDIVFDDSHLTGRTWAANKSVLAMVKKALRKNA